RSTTVGDVRIMLPLINEISEVTRTRALLDECIDELEREGTPVPRDYSLGAMVETPAAALLAAELAGHVDFFSIGTNDLVQYTLAVDRGTSRLAALYNPFHPAVVRLLHSVAGAGRAAGIEVGVCGEFAANPLGAFLLIGMGVHSLSVGPSALAEIKKVIRSVDQSQARLAVDRVLAAASPREVEEILIDALRDQLDLARFP